MINVKQKRNGYFLHYCIAKDELVSRPQDLLALKSKIEAGKFPELSNEGWLEKLLEKIDDDYTKSVSIRSKLLGAKRT